MGTTSQKLPFTFFFLLCFSIVCLIVSLVPATEAGHRHHHHHGRRQQKLFVFGDSYVDTGNNMISTSSSWKPPYGITFPGKPSGRFSDGRVFTDFLATSLGLKTPIAYRWRKYSHSKLKYGMNFAFGGTGVFDTRVPYPNMTTQIDIFQRLLSHNVFTPYDVQTSVALVALSGNDYYAFLARGATAQDLQKFIPQVVKQLVLNIQRLYSLGVRKIAVTALQPLGCLPVDTFTTMFQQCNSTSNQAVSFHNLLLRQGVSQLNNQTQDPYHPPVIVIDMFNAFLSVFQQRDTNTGSLLFNNPLKPCCMGVNQNYSCGSVDAMGKKMYTVCEDPQSAFFWDIVHPTQAGWRAVSLALQATLEQLHSE